MLTEEKKQRILEAALQEFAERGYEKASTNGIIQAAGVSKGLLFHYFGSKKNLYLHTLDMCLAAYLRRFDQETTNLSRNLIERFMEVSRIKLKIATDNPLLQRIITSAFIEPPAELKDELQSRQLEIYQKYLPLLIEKIDHSFFKEGIDPEKAIDLIMIVVNSLGDRFFQEYRESPDKSRIDLAAYTQKVNGYILMIKTGIYK